MITVSGGASANVAAAAGRYRSQSIVRNSRRKSPIVAQTTPGRVQIHAWSKIAIGDPRDTRAGTTVHGGHQIETSEPTQVAKVGAKGLASAGRHQTTPLGGAE